MELSVVIPVYNEAGCIRALLDEVRTALDGAIDYEVVVVDDGSDDGTAAVLQAGVRELAMLRVLRHSQCCGQSAAIGSGVRAARGHWIATLDGDGQNEPGDIMRLYEAMDSGDDCVQLVTGLRRRRRDSRVKRLASRVANSVRAAVLGDDTPDTGCGIKLFARDTWNSLPQFDHMHRFLPALVLRNGGEVLSVPVNHRERRTGQSKYGVLDRLRVGIVDLLGVWWLMRRNTRPVVTEIE